MNQASKTKLRSTLAALIAALVMFGPDILEALSVTDASPKWLKLLAKGAGLLIGLATSGRAVAILNKFLPDDNAKPSGPVPPVAAVLALLAGIGLLGYSVPARADEPVPVTPQIGFKIGSYTTCQPATAAGWQLNLKTNSWQRFSFLQGFGCTYRGWQQPLGVAAYVGYAAANDGTSGYQGALLFSYADFVAAGPGTQTFLDPVTRERYWQGTVNVVANFNWGASTARFTSAVHDVRAGKAVQ